MKRRKGKSIFLSTVLGVATLFGVGHGAFIVKGDASKDGLTISEGTAAVCYIKYSETSKTHYTSIEKALEVAKADPAENQIYVIPGLDRVISRKCEIAAGDTLYLPFEGETCVNREGPASSNAFADMTEALVKANRTSLVTVMPGVSISVYGTLTIGGVLDNPSIGLSGQTTGHYAEMLFKAGNAGVEPASLFLYSGGILDLVGGYIKKDVKGPDAYAPKVVANNGSQIKLPFVIYDYQGGNTTGGIFAAGHSFGVTDLYKTVTIDGYVCPFRVYDAPNLQIIADIYSGATVTGYLSLSTGELTVLGVTIAPSYNLSTTTLIGSSGSILSISSGYARFKYENVDDCLYTPFTWNKAQTKIEIFGTVTHQALQMTLNAQILKIAINTSKILFPVSYRYSIVVKNGGVLNLPNPIKFMNGSSLLVEQGGQVNATSSVIFYTQPWTDSKPGNKYLVGAPGGSAAVTGVALFINNGTVNLSSSAKAGAKISSQIEGSTLSVNTDTQSVTAIECNGTGARSGIHYEFSSKDEVSIVEALSIKDYVSNETLFYVNPIAKGEYHSKFNNLNDFGYYSHTIYYANVFSGSNPNASYYVFDNPNRCYVSPQSHFLLSDPTYRKVNSSASDLTFGGFYLDSSFTTVITEFSYNEIANYFIGTNLTIYVKWNEILPGVMVRLLQRNGTLYSEQYFDSTVADISFPSYPALDPELDVEADGTNRVVNVLTKGVTGWEIISDGSFSDGQKMTGNISNATVVGEDGSVIEIRPVDGIVASKPYYLVAWEDGSRPNLGNRDADAYCMVSNCLIVDTSDGDFGKDSGQQRCEIDQGSGNGGSGALYAYVLEGASVTLYVKGYTTGFLLTKEDHTVTMTAKNEDRSIRTSCSATGKDQTNSSQFAMPAHAIYLTASHD